MKFHSVWIKRIIIVCIGVLLSGGALLLADLTGLTITGSETYTDPNELSIANSTVEPGGHLTLKAGNLVRLEPGFHAKRGSRLTVQVDPNLETPFLSSMPPATGNDRFLEELFMGMQRPGLSIIGFDNGENNSNGFG